jgi:hypothetical protein
MSRLMHPIAYEFECNECTPGGRLRWLCGLAPEQRGPSGNGACPQAQPASPPHCGRNASPGKERSGKTTGWP